MGKISCFSVAKFFSPILAKNLKDEDIQFSVNFTDPDVTQDIVHKCITLLTTIFMNSLPEQVEKFIEQEYYQSYMMTIGDIKVPIKYHTINPSLFELSASKIAHYLFPENFAEYKFLIQSNITTNDEVDAGYLPSVDETLKCKVGRLEGVENVYATAVYLGLEIRSHQCIESGEESYLFINDFSHAFHKIDTKQKALIEEYRDHKISQIEEGNLFPISFLNAKCGEWISRECDVGKLKNAYEKIINTPQSTIKEIINTAIFVLQSIECKNSKDDACKSGNHYQYMHEVEGILSDNYDAITLFLANDSSQNDLH